MQNIMSAKLKYVRLYSVFHVIKELASTVHTGECFDMCLIEPLYSNVLWYKTVYM